MFTRIDELVVGDYFYIYVLNQTLKYEVYEIDVVLPDDVSSLTIESGRDLVTLITCTPYGVNTHRLLVKAERTEYTQEEETEETESINLMVSSNVTIYYVIVVIIGVIALIFIIYFMKTNRKTIIVN